MIFIYKIGQSWYNDHDKNSGLFERQIIAQEVANITCTQSVLIVINGKFYNDDEKRYLSCLMNEYEIKIFIASDIVALETNRDIIDKCQYLLHQCPNNDLIQNSSIKQFYSWVPEIFYTYSCKLKPNTEKINKLIFGGGVRDNEKQILEYLKAVPSVAYLKTDSYDNRLEYFEYLEELAKYKFALIIARQAYNDIGWVTARYAEAIANNVIPICDDKYDKTNHFANVRVHDAEGLAFTYLMFSQDDDLHRKILSQEHAKLSSRQNNFRNLIIDIIGGKYAD